MNNNVVFYFSGTGNSLKAAKDIAVMLGNCSILPMTKKTYSLTESYDAVGFVYPVYYGGLPHQVEQFTSSLNVEKSRDSYYFAVATNGGLCANGLSQLGDILKKKSVTLAYHEKLKMFSNYVAWYDMKKEVGEVTASSDKAILPILQSIKSRKTNHINKPNNLVGFYHRKMISRVQTLDQHFTISDACTSCGICKKVCPAENIELKDGSPTFNRHCEQCMACIQYCPQRAINYLGRTEKRGRYTNPSIDYKELSQMNSSEGD